MLSSTPLIESRQLPQSIEVAASPLGSIQASKLPELHFTTIQAVVEQLKSENIPIRKIQSWLNRITKEFKLPTLGQWSYTLASVKHILANWIKARKLYDQPEEHIHKITSGIDGSVWIQGVTNDSLNGEGHQNIYYPLDSISEQELQQKVQQLGEIAQVKTPRTRIVLKRLLKKYGNFFMTKGMKFAGTVKTEHHIDLKDGYKVQHYTLPKGCMKPKRKAGERSKKAL